MKVQIVPVSRYSARVLVDGKHVGDSSDCEFDRWIIQGTEIVEGHPLYGCFAGHGHSGLAYAISQCVDGVESSEVLFTPIEKQVLAAAIESSAGNGHDFGFTEDIVRDLPGLSPQQIGGAISSLLKKGVFSVVHEAHDAGAGSCHQFELAREYTGKSAEY